ncbi:MAG: PhzF family phenazine biosynthesis protein [Acidobacteria bacterium]|nr:PhzF family phenazine biosynthesis protein [Acidobacteriota bacterium]
MAMSQSRQNPVSHRLSFLQLDVFTTVPLQGNPLAVFADARTLRQEQMQAIAREMNLSETTFILPGEPNLEAERGVRVRIFTPAQELPFAGHPTLGTAFALRGESRTPVIKLDLNVGTVPVRFQDRPGEPSFAEMTQPQPVFGALHNPGKIAEVTGVPLEDLDTQLPIQTISTGFPFTIVPVRGLAAIGRVSLEQARASAYLEASGSQLFYFVSRETADPSARLHARMLFRNGEDPATGSAAGCTAAWMVEHGVAQPEEQVWIEQGLEILRPSRIFVRASRQDDRVVNVRVGGNVVEVLQGEIFF